MFYKSTRDENIRVSAAQAIAQGISQEGGLFVPESIPWVGERLSQLAALDYQGLAREILALYLTDYSLDEIAGCVEKAYAPEKFGGQDPARLVKLDGGRYMLELWHGPTCAFKDMALQLLPHLLTKALEKKYGGKKAVILVATSGDTGKAALEGFKDVEGTQILVFYPDNGVSPMQLRQMNTQGGENVSVCAVEGNFDDCQTQVKKIFTDREMNSRLAENGMIFSSANSINWGRLLPQIVYYFYAYFRLFREGAVGNLEEKIDIAVPTGNFGNILAAYYAMKMGLPVRKFICASNSNNVLTDFIRTGSYDSKREFFTTLSPSMDILVSSNLERLLYHLCGEDCVRLREWMGALADQGRYTVDSGTAETVRELFWGGCCSDAETISEIGRVFGSFGYLADPHTAVALKVADRYKKEIPEDSAPCLAVSTASPYKFTRSVMEGLGGSSHEDEFLLAEKLEELSGVRMPAQLKALREKPVRFLEKCARETISDFVLRTVGVQ